MLRRLALQGKPCLLNESWSSDHFALALTHCSAAAFRGISSRLSCSGVC